MKRVIYSNQFKKDWDKLKRQKKELSKLEVVIIKLAKGEKLEAKYKDHKLHGDKKDYRDLHVEPDWVLIYKFSGKDEIILVRTGSHSEIL